MFQTAFTLSLTQFARTLSLPERLQHSPLRNLALEGLRQRNLALDALFYDVKVITPEEAFYISDSLAAEGAIMLIPPSGLGALTLCETIDEFVLRGGTKARALAVAGIGGSALGAAAFARNVADAIDAPVAVVVSGYGIADAITEAFGGSFFFGHLRGLRPLLESLDDLAGRPRFGAQAETAAARSSLDTRTVQALLADPRLSFPLLTGHSKGNLVLSAALHNLSKQDKGRVAELARHTKIVTIGARIAMPPVFNDVIDVMGEWDWFGEINSRRFIHADQRVAHAWHHTNTDLGGHLPVTITLMEILAASPIAEDQKAGEHQAAKLGAATERPAIPVTKSPSPSAGGNATAIEKVKKAFSAMPMPSTQPPAFGPSDEPPPTMPH
ncbi:MULTISPECIES: hypothetical protein [unclassified Rhizobium]|uniref:hypothetical protein n=1 Tax=unclassified Rhizobium TaxID=2613769 RepID=UPI00254E6C0E|nr:hypothetical protein [Rhizobium sp. CNPSo 4062]MDK4700995.1 hypothetical protein [Rhizobium sp. CNPSo 4062]